MNSSRILSVDILKLFAIFLVLWGHMVQYLLGTYYLDEPVYRYIYSFHMPLFMMMSGLFAEKAMRLSAGAFLLRKFRQLLLPCLTWGLLMSLGNMIQPLLNGAEIDKSLFSTLITNFWFLKSLFVCFVLAYAGRRLLSRYHIWIPVTIAVSQFISAYSVQWMYPAFVLGWLAGNYGEYWRPRSLRLAAVLLLLFLLSLFFWDKEVFLLSPTVWYMRLYRILTGLLGASGCLCLALGIEQRRIFPAVERLARWGQLTLGVYILQSIAFILHDRFFPFMCDDIPILLFQVIIAPIGALVLLALCLLGTWVISRIPYLNTLLLGTGL